MSYMHPLVALILIFVVVGIVAILNFIFKSREPMYDIPDEEPEEPKNQLLQSIKETLADSQREPKIGEQWIVISSNGNPWGSSRCRPVVIRDIRDGWIRYTFGKDSLIEDGRMPLKEFLEVYIPYPPEPEMPSIEVNSVLYTAEK